MDSGEYSNRKNLVSAARSCERSVSGAGAGGRRNGNGAVSGQNLPLKIRSTVKPLMEKRLNRFLKLL